jgi:lipopolysaccharide/colanic/teichoic acid biosynthesis glycosyltransferase
LPWGPVGGLLVALDVLAVSFGITAAYWLRFQGHWFVGFEPRTPTFPPATLGLYGLIFLLIFAFAGLYRRRNLVSGLREYGLVLAACVATVLAVIVASYLLIHPSVSRGFLLLSAVCVMFAVALGRFGLRRFLYRKAKRGRCLDRVLIIGANSQARAVAQQLSESPSASAEVVGFLSDYAPVDSALEGVRVLGEPLQLETIAKQLAATKAVVVESALSYESLRGLTDVMHTRRSIDVFIAPGLFGIHSTPMRSEQLGPVQLLAPASARIVGMEAVFKRALDLGLALSGLIVAIPIMATLAALALVDGEGLGLVSETHLTANGQLTLTRFRKPEWAVSLHLSRLPELLEVLRGRLSVIGPRPIAFARADSYSKVISVLEAAKPGFIGPWWLAGRSRPLGFEDEIAYDLFYLRNYSLWLDIEILIKAVRGLILQPRAVGWEGRLERVSQTVPAKASAFGSSETGPPSKSSFEGDG